jgi:hypothetical protein
METEHCLKLAGSKVRWACNSKLWEEKKISKNILLGKFVGFAEGLGKRLGRQGFVVISATHNKPKNFTQLYTY